MYMQYTSHIVSMYINSTLTIYIILHQVQVCFLCVEVKEKVGGVGKEGVGDVFFYLDKKVIRLAGKFIVNSWYMHINILLHSLLYLKKKFIAYFRGRGAFVI